MTMHEVAFTLPRSGITLRGRRTGTPTDTPIVCLHGWLDNCASFAPLMHRAPELDLIAVDLPGHGLSDPGPGIIYDLLDYAACVLELAHAQQWHRFGLIGHSMGGVVAAITAALHPRKVIDLVLIDIVGLFTATPEQTTIRLAGYLDAYLSDQRPRPYPTRDQATRTRVHLGDMSHNAAEQLCERDLELVSDGYAWRTDPRLKYPFPLTFDQEQMHALLRRVEAPTLRIVAQRDTPPPSLCHGLLDILLNLRSVTIPGGHHLHMENADPVAAEIRQFIRTTRSSVVRTPYA